MKINENKLIPYLIIIVPLALVLTSSFFISSFYLEKVTQYFTSAKEKRMDDFLKTKKAKGEMWIKQLNLLFEYKNARIEEKIKKELRVELDLAYKISQYIHKKYKNTKSKKDIQQRIVEALKNVSYKGINNHIFITDFLGNNILSGSHKLSKKNILSFEDSDHRSIVLEEIQKVKKSGEGFINSDFFKDGESLTIMVKDLKIYDWFIGTSIYDKNVLKESKSFILDMIKSIPLEEGDVLAIYEDNKLLYSSSDLNPDYKYINSFYKPFDWKLVYAFDISTMSAKELVKYKKLEKMLDDELAFIVKISILIIVFVVLLSLLLSRKINKIFKKYREDLESLNKSLEIKVQQEVQAHRAKDKMLIQRSKMAEMGDMLSMIAHQWRQPLNQMSYVFMNIDSAYEYKELTKEYLDEKIKEGNELLEFMSQTIEDFRNYFKPDKEKEFVLVGDVVQKCLDFMKQPLANASIEVEFIQDGRELTHIYKNEFIQVVLNLLKNARDILVQKDVTEPKITIRSISTTDSLVLSIEDNGGGIDEKIKDKIFDPYFSTKDEQNGTGLGLYMSKMIIEEHIDGSLSVENTQSGAKFIIKI